jgi:hypothetical protein
MYKEQESCQETETYTSMLHSTHTNTERLKSKKNVLF